MRFFVIVFGNEMLTSFARLPICLIRSRPSVPFDISTVVRISVQKASHDTLHS